MFFGMTTRRRIERFSGGIQKQKVDKRFPALLAFNGPELLRLAGRYTNSRSNRVDLFQDIPLAIWRALPGFRGESSDRRGDMA
jgi:DNA-directed RNA polymerase specialized sigma24 family protein